MQFNILMMSVVHFARRQISLVSEIPDISRLNYKSEAGVNGFSYSAAKA